MTDTPWLTPQQLESWIKLQAVVELLPGALDSQLRRDSGLSHYEYLVLAMLSDAPDESLRMTSLASQTNATLPRLSHVVTRLEGRGYVERLPCEDDRRATTAHLTDKGRTKLTESAPGHVRNVRSLIIDPLTDEQVDQLTEITTVILSRLDPQGLYASNALGHH